MWKFGKLSDSTMENCDVHLWVHKLHFAKQKFENQNFPIEQKTRDKMLSREIPFRRLEKFSWMDFPSPQILFLKNARKKCFPERQQHCEHHPCHVIVSSFLTFFYFPPFNKRETNNNIFPLFQRQQWRNSARILITELNCAMSQQRFRFFCFREGGDTCDDY